jgi:hemolysin activation/secretion protein
VNLYWQRNPDKGQTFDLQADVPYLFKSNVGLNMKVNIFRQDSTYANVKALPAFYYHINSRNKIGFRGTFESSTIIDTLYVQGKDYNKKGLGIWYEMVEPTDIDLFLYKTKISAGYDYLTTTYTKDNIKSPQNQFYFFGEHNYHINGNHFLNIKAEGAMMDSKIDFSANELYRFGGWNSMRGFNENSLAADFYYYGSLEYRYLIGNQAFFDVFGQYGQLNNKSLNVKPKLYSVGLGFNFFIPIGLMSFQLSNGNEFGNPFKFNDIKIHWGILSRF